MKFYVTNIATLGLKSKNRTVDIGFTVGHDGSAYWNTRASKFNSKSNTDYDNQVVRCIKAGYNKVKDQELVLAEFSERYGFKFGKVGESI